MAAFQPYAGAFCVHGETFRWSCYATRRVYELRALDPDLPDPPVGRKWVTKRQHGLAGPHLALLVDQAAPEFSHMLAQISQPQPKPQALAPA
jgi:hypothetical protein